MYLAKSYRSRIAKPRVHRARYTSSSSRLLNPLATLQEKQIKQWRKDLNITPENPQRIDNVFSIINCAAEKKLITHLPSGLFRTRTHLELIDELNEKTCSLVNNVFRSRCGVSSRTLLGAKGIGKSTTLRAFTTVSPLLFSKVIPIYISYHSLEDNDYFRQTKLSAILKTELGKIGISVVADNPQAEDIIDSLEKNDRYLLLIVDELDKLFETKVDLDTSSRTIGALKSFAEDERGRTCTLVCGSSASLPLLITNKAIDDEVLRRRFPLVEKVTSMNGSKFEEIHIHSSVPTELDSIRSMLGNSISNEHALVISFLAGANARQLAKLSSSIEGRKLMGSVSDPLASIQTALQPVKVKEAATDTYSKFGLFYDLMIDKMKNNNQYLFDAITKDGNLLLSEVAKQQWQNFRPLTEEEVFSCHKKAYGTASSDKQKVKRDLYFLADRTWIILGDRGAGFPQQVYPAKFIDVALNDPVGMKAKISLLAKQIQNDELFSTFTGVLGKFT